MLLNFSNHPYSTWSPEQQTTAAKSFGKVVDLPFPPVDASASISEVAELARESIGQIISLIKLSGEEKATVHISGEYTLVYQVVNMLRKMGVPAVVSTSHRKVKINPDGSKTMYFDFVRFREYY